MIAADDRTVRFRLKRPFPLLRRLGKPARPCPSSCRSASRSTDPFQQITESIGSGPFRFLRDEWRAGRSAAMRATRATCRATSRPPASPAARSCISTASNGHHARCRDRRRGDADRRGGLVGADPQPRPRAGAAALAQRAGRIVRNPLGTFMTMRFNHLHPPFNNPAVRRAVMLGRSTRRDYGLAIVGNNAELAGAARASSPAARRWRPPREQRRQRAAAQRRHRRRRRQRSAGAGYAGEKVIVDGSRARSQTTSPRRRSPTT